MYIVTPSARLRALILRGYPDIQDIFSIDYYTMEDCG